MSLASFQISSRPAKRKASGGFAAMRAIPWMFSWMQSRAIVPSWFGLGTAFQTYAQADDAGMPLPARDVPQLVPSSRALIDNAQLDVAKADMGIAELYASLVEPPELRERFFSWIKAEHSLSSQLITRVTCRDGLLGEYVGDQDIHTAPQPLCGSAELHAGSAAAGAAPV